MKTTPQSKMNWQIKIDMLIAVLITSAQTITYDELARQAEIPAPHRIHQLTNYLEALIADDAQNNQPIRAAVVISKIRHLPAPGFFDAVRLYHDSRHHLDDLALYKQLLVALNPAYDSALFLNQE